MKHLLSLILIFAVIGCGLLPEKVSYNDPRVQTLIKSAESFNRTACGFTPVSPDSDFRLEISKFPQYDAMLHIYRPKESRTIAFRQTDTGYVWIGEQQLFFGPNQYEGADGLYFENICLNYDTEKISGFPLNELAVSYHGEDSLLKYSDISGDLTLSDVNPYLVKWGFKK